MIWPVPLEKGDTVALTAPSGPGDPALLEPSVQALEKFGLRVKVMDSCQKRHGYLAASDVQRANDINSAFADCKVKGIFAWRGGYGAQRILPLLDYEMIRRHPKVFAGYSDITALHTVLNQVCGFITFHAPMPATELCQAVDTFTLQAFKRFILMDPPPTHAPHGYGKPPLLMRNPEGIDLDMVSPGYAEGMLTGGNLSLVSSSIGTPFEIDTRGRILFLEEVHEEPYRIDRMLLQLKQAGKFRDCAGVLLGSFRPEEVSGSLRMAVEELIIPEGKPVLAGVACGHCMPTLTLPMGAAAFLDASHGKWGLYA